MPTILGANTLSSGYDVANSVRFNNDDSAQLHKTRGGKLRVESSGWRTQGRELRGKTEGGSNAKQGEN